MFFETKKPGLVTNYYLDWDRIKTIEDVVKVLKAVYPNNKISCPITSGLNDYVVAKIEASD